jgi:hypothetical protein
LQTTLASEAELAEGQSEAIEQSRICDVPSSKVQIEKDRSYNEDKAAKGILLLHKVFNGDSDDYDDDNDSNNNRFNCSSDIWNSCNFSMFSVRLHSTLPT